MKHYEREQFLTEADITYSFIFNKQAEKRALQRRKTRMMKQNDLDGVAYCEAEIATVEAVIDNAAKALYTKATWIR